MGKAKIELEELVEGKTLIKVRPTNPKFRVLLSIDGGGVRGVIPATVLKGFERAVKEVAKEVSAECRALDDDELVVDIKDCFDVVSGNSAGSILALFIASGGGDVNLYKKGGLLHGHRRGSTEAAISLVSKVVEDIFKPSTLGKIPVISTLAALFFSKYGHLGLAGALEKVFGDLTLDDLEMNAYIPAYELNNARPVGFYCRHFLDGTGRNCGYTFPRDVRPRRMPAGHSKRLTNTGGHPHLFERKLVNMPLKIAARASSSAPIYFSSTSYTNKNLGDMLGCDGDEVRWVDGGVVSNNPTMQALAFMSANYACRKTHEILKMDQMAVLSLGTGGRRTPPNVRQTQQGLVWWGTDLISVLMDSHTEVNHRIIDAMFDGSMFGDLSGFDRYVRINRMAYPGDEHYETLDALDSVDKVDDLIKVGEELVIEYWEDMKEFVRSVLLAGN